MADRRASTAGRTTMKRMLRRRRVARRIGISEDARETVASMSRPDQTVNLVLVALTDGVEVELYADGALRRRLRFLRDSEARKYMERLAVRLATRGYARQNVA